MSEFKLDSKLANDCFFIGNLNLSQLLLMNDSNYPWLILVPAVPNATELIDLKLEEQHQLLQEINQISQLLKENFTIDKLNIATLGNVVSQLHIHIIGRNKNDVSFPNPVWGQKPTQPYDAKRAEEIIKLFQQKFNFLKTD